MRFGLRMGRSRDSMLLREPCSSAEAAAVEAATSRTCRDAPLRGLVVAAEGCAVVLAVGGGDDKASLCCLRSLARSRASLRVRGRESSASASSSLSVSVARRG